MTRVFPHSGNRGFSVVELLLAVVIAAILIGAAMPSFLTLVTSSRIDGATRQLLYEIRSAQSLAISRGGVFGFQWGGDPGPPPAGQLDSMYRVVRVNGGCDFPDVDAPVDGTDVIRGWLNLAGEYPGVTIQSVQDLNNTEIGYVMFNSRGASINNCVVPAPTFPLTITTVDNSGATRTIQIGRAGRVSII